MTRQEYDNLPEIEKIKARLLSEMSFRVHMIVGDCETFGRVRLDQHEWYDDRSKYSLGGGNFVIAHAACALLSFLAKTYRFFVAPEEFATKESRDLVERSINHIKDAANSDALKNTEHSENLK